MLYTVCAAEKWIVEANASVKIGKWFKRGRGIVGALLKPVLTQWLLERARPADKGCGVSFRRPVQNGPQWRWQCRLTVNEDTLKRSVQRDFKPSAVKA